VNLRTPAQTIGPFFTHALTWPDGPYVVAEGTPGAVWVRGRVLDGEGEPVTDALVETWQRNPDGFGRCPTDAQGRYGILTVEPGPVDGETPHLTVSLFARGLLDRVVTRIYFPGNVDPEFPGLVAEPTADGYRFDIWLQGERETVFFAM
jgi:protocatechuate 3,4-dioxygenase alpha subunit